MNRLNNRSIHDNDKNNSNSISSNSSSNAKSNRKIMRMSNKLMSSMSSLTEKSLVSHVRTSIPMESLRELAEEIGMTNQDCNIIHKVC